MPTPGSPRPALGPLSLNADADAGALSPSPRKSPTRRADGIFDRVAEGGENSPHLRLGTPASPAQSVSLAPPDVDSPSLLLQGPSTRKDAPPTPTLFGPAFTARRAPPCPPSRSPAFDASERAFRAAKAAAEAALEPSSGSSARSRSWGRRAAWDNDGGASPSVSFGSVVAPARGSPTAQETDTATSAPYAQAQAQASAPTLRLSPLTLVRSLQQACSPRPGLANASTVAPPMAAPPAGPYDIHQDAATPGPSRLGTQPASVSSPASPAVVIPALSPALALVTAATGPRHGPPRTPASIQRGNSGASPFAEPAIRVRTPAQARQAKLPPNLANLAPALRFLAHYDSPGGAPRPAPGAPAHTNRRSSRKERHGRTRHRTSAQKAPTTATETLTDDNKQPKRSSPTGDQARHPATSPVAPTPPATFAAAAVAAVPEAPAPRRSVFKERSPTGSAGSQGTKSQDSGAACGDAAHDTATSTPRVHPTQGYAGLLVRGEVSPTSGAVGLSWPQLGAGCEEGGSGAGTRSLLSSASAGRSDRTGSVAGTPRLGPVNVDIGSASRFGCDSSSDAGPDGEPDTLLHDAEPLRLGLEDFGSSSPATPRAKGGEGREGAPAPPRTPALAVLRVEGGPTAAADADAGAGGVFGTAAAMAPAFGHARAAPAAAEGSAHTQGGQGDAAEDAADADSDADSDAGSDIVTDVSSVGDSTPGDDVVDDLTHDLGDEAHTPTQRHDQPATITGPATSGGPGCAWAPSPTAVVTTINPLFRPDSLSGSPSDSAQPTSPSLTCTATGPHHRPASPSSPLRPASPGVSDATTDAPAATLTYPAPGLAPPRSPGPSLAAFSASKATRVPSAAPAPHPRLAREAMECEAAAEAAFGAGAVRDGGSVVALSPVRAPRGLLLPGEDGADAAGVDGNGADVTCVDATCAEVTDGSPVQCPPPARTPRRAPRSDVVSPVRRTARRTPSRPTVGDAHEALQGCGYAYLPNRALFGTEEGAEGRMEDLAKDQEGPGMAEGVTVDAAGADGGGADAEAVPAAHEEGAAGSKQSQRKRSQRSRRQRRAKGGTEAQGGAACTAEGGNEGGAAEGVESPMVAGPGSGAGAVDAGSSPSPDQLVVGKKAKRGGEGSDKAGAGGEGRGAVRRSQRLREKAQRDGQ